MISLCDLFVDMALQLWGENNLSFGLIRRFFRSINTLLVEVLLLAKGHDELRFKIGIVRLLQCGYHILFQIPQEDSR